MSEPISYNDLPHYTIEDYKRWEGNWEIIRGIPYAMSPVPRRRHQEISTVISALFYLELDKCQSCKIYQPIDVIFDEDTVVQPDVSIVCGKNPEDTRSLPILVVEILSHSTAFKDRNLKFRLYESNGVRYYWIVDPENKFVEIYELVDGKYIRIDLLNTLTFDLGECQFSFDFEKIW